MAKKRDDTPGTPPPGDATGGGPRALAAPPTSVVSRHADGSYVLTRPEQEILDEVLEDGNATHERITAELTRFGKAAFRKVFRRETGWLVDEAKRPNPVWRELRRRAGGPTLALIEPSLSFAVRIAAWDQTINDQAFKDLDPERKKLLLPLKDGDRMREAAQHIAKHQLSYRMTEELVRNLRRKADEAPAVRLTPARLDKRLDGVAELGGTAQGRKAITRLAKSLTPDRRAALRRKAEATAKAMALLLEALGEED
jgi:hypothetical protein